jgi:hypothetical protein
MFVNLDEIDGYVFEYKYKYAARVKAIIYV